VRVELVQAALLRREELHEAIVQPRLLQQRHQVVDVVRRQEVGEKLRHKRQDGALHEQAWAENCRT